jgi:hypothetical protein
MSLQARLSAVGPHFDQRSKPRSGYHSTSPRERAPCDSDIGENSLGSFRATPTRSRCARPADAGSCLVRVAGKIGSASGDQGRPSRCTFVQVWSQHPLLVKHTVPLFAGHLLFCLGNTTVITRAPSATKSKARRSLVVGHGSVFQARRWISWSR